METPKRKKPTKMLRCRWLDELRRQQRLARRATNRKSICCGESGTSTTNGYAGNLHVLAKRLRTRMNGRVTNYLWSKFADLRLSFRKWTIWKKTFLHKSDKTNFQRYHSWRLMFGNLLGRRIEGSVCIACQAKNKTHFFAFNFEKWSNAWRCHLEWTRSHWKRIKLSVQKEKF